MVFRCAIESNGFTAMFVLLCFEKSCFMWFSQIDMKRFRSVFVLKKSCAIAPRSRWMFTSVWFSQIELNRFSFVFILGKSCTIVSSS